MENRTIRAVDPASLTTLVLLVLLVVFGWALAHPTTIWADDGCGTDELCRIGGDTGGTPGTPAPPVTPPPGDDNPGQPGNPGNPDEPGNPDQPPANPPGNPGQPGQPAPTPAPGNPYTYAYCATHPMCPERANFTYICNGPSCWTVNVVCVSEAACTPQPAQPPSEDQAPCEPVYDPGSGITFQCEGDDGNGLHWDYSLNVWAKVPPAEVEMCPFPRWLVATPGTLTLLPEPRWSQEGGPEGGAGESGFWSAKISLPPTADPANPKPGDIKEYRIGVRWRRLSTGENVFGSPVPFSCFNWDERAWNVGRSGAYSCGDSAAHAYETSSWGLPAVGPSFHPENAGCSKVGAWNLPSYLVTVPTFWVAEWADEWWRWEKSGTEWSDCQCVGTGQPAGVPTESCDAPPGICVLPGQWYGKIGQDHYEWVHHFVGWDAYDLQALGRGDTWYHVSWKVKAKSCDTEWCPGGYRSGVGSAIPIPVIEVQSIIVGDCRLTGSCGGLESPPAEDHQDDQTPPEESPPPPPGSAPTPPPTCIPVSPP